jgi:hypothetical protein
LLIVDAAWCRSLLWWTSSARARDKIIYGEQLQFVEVLLGRLLQHYDAPELMHYVWPVFRSWQLDLRSHRRLIQNYWCFVGKIFVQLLEMMQRQIAAACYFLEMFFFMFSHSHRPRPWLTSRATSHPSSSRIQPDSPA